MNPTVSVIMPAYNASKYLHETITSVLSQTFDNFELLIVDDGSTDNSAEIAHKYGNEDSRIKIFCQENKGVSVARNTGISLSSGKFIAFIDADDQWLPDKLACHINHLNMDENLGISFGKVEFINDDSNGTGKFSNSILNNLTPLDFYYENPIITPSNAVLRRDVLEQIGGFDKNLKGTEDAELFLRAAYMGWKVEGIARVLTRYRISQKGVSSQLYRMEEDWNRLNKKVQIYAPNLVNEHYSQAKAMFLRYLARQAFRLNLPSHIGIEFMNRALYSDWKIILRQPQRTTFTILAVYSQYLHLLKPFNSINSRSKVGKASVK
ncbi:MAG: glycosyltransferase [Nostoc indistinguendum CM1-VF10]|jgi:glycosyltransferase involved in cell wall biosynthesis|nr:glycosyltransferase [Nostoc indistinguendum CM1-VF10]